MGDFKKLLVWQKAHAFALQVHATTGKIRGSHNASLRGQLNRAAQSISTNIVEGRSWNSDPEFRRFLRFSLRSAAETEHHLIVARDIHAISQAEFDRLEAQLTEVCKMLYGLISTLGLD